MKAYGHPMRSPIHCCPGHSVFAVQSKYAPHGPRFDRDASRRPWKKSERQLAKREVAVARLEAAPERTRAGTAGTHLRGHRGKDA
jgi:hypothetical protein